MPIIDWDVNAVVVNGSKRPITSVAARLLQWGSAVGSKGLSSRHFSAISKESESEKVPFDATELAESPEVFDQPLVEVEFSVAGERWLRGGDDGLYRWRRRRLLRWRHYWKHEGY